MTRSEPTSHNSPDSGPVTLINVFEIRPEQLDGFLGEWHQRADFMAKQPGFQSFRLHRALSPDTRFQLVNVAEWDSAEALRAATSQPEFLDSVSRSLAEFDVTAHPGVYGTAIEMTARSALIWSGPNAQRSYEEAFELGLCSDD
jgi:heme oxygenase (mycobilin-producing)